MHLFRLPTVPRTTRAMLAGGLALGLGAAVTLASWSDSIWTSGAFRAGQFAIQGSSSQTTTHTWSDYPTQAGSAQLTFSSSSPTTVTPGSSYYAPFSLAINSTKADFNASVTLTESVGSGDTALLAALNWGARLVPNPTQCTAANYSAGTALTANDALATTTAHVSATPFILDKANNTTAAGKTPITVCFKVTVPPQSNPDPSETTLGTGTATIQWHFVATSQ